MRAVGMEPTPRPDDRMTAGLSPAPSDEERAHRLLYPHDELELGRYDVDVIAVMALIAEVRLETIAQCKAAHDAGLPWGSPFTSATRPKGGT